MMIQDEEHPALLQFFVELKNNINVRDDTISRLESKLQVQDKVHAQQQQWSHPWPPNPHLYHTPSFTPFFPTPNHWFQENYHFPPHSVVQPPDYYSSPPVMVDQPSVTPFHVYPPVESTIHQSSFSLTQLRWKTQRMMYHAPLE